MFIESGAACATGGLGLIGLGGLRVLCVCVCVYVYMYVEQRRLQPRHNSPIDSLLADKST